MNVSGAGVTRYAKKRKGAVRLIEWLSSEKAQNLYADVNMEYPVNRKVNVDPVVAKWGFQAQLHQCGQGGRAAS